VGGERLHSTAGQPPGEDGGEIKKGKNPPKLFLERQGGRKAKSLLSAKRDQGLDVKAGKGSPIWEYHFPGGIHRGNERKEQWRKTVEKPDKGRGVN